MLRDGRAVSRWAAAGGHTSSANTSRLPVTWLAPAAATPSTSRKTTATSRAGIPCAAAVSGSIDVHNSGRPTAASAAKHTTAATSSTTTWELLTPAMVPNRRFVSPDRNPWYRLTNNKPVASATACTVPITADCSPYPRPLSAAVPGAHHAIAAAAATHATK
jgi:hypothetical protein